MGFDNLQIWLKNLRHSDNAKKNESYDKIEEDDEAPIEAKKDDKNPGKVKLNGGSHDNVMGLNRKMVVVIGSLIFTIVAASYIYNIQDEAARKALKDNAVNTHDKAATMHNFEPGYEQVFNQSNNGLSGANNKFNNRNNSVANNGEDPLLALNKNGNGQNNTVNNNGTNRNSSAVVAAPATVPQIPAYNHTSTATVATPQQAPKISEEERAETEKQKNEATKYRSPISFSIGNNSGGSGQTAQGSEGNGNAAQGGESGTKTTGASSANFPSTSIPYMEASDNVLQAGSLIPAMLFSGINTDVEGQITAQTIADVYDTATHSNLLIPMGSQLIGTYTATASDGNNRVKVSFSTIVLPDGSAYAVDNSLVAVDGAGYNGIAGKIDHHTDKAIRDGLLNSAFTALSSKWANRVYLDMSTITNLTKGIQPTITINPGKEFNLFVTKPIIFPQ